MTCLFQILHKPKVVCVIAILLVSICTFLPVRARKGRKKAICGFRAEQIVQRFILQKFVSPANGCIIATPSAAAVFMRII